MRYILATVFLFLTIGVFGQNPLYTRTSYRVVNSAVNDTFYIEFQGDSVRLRGNHGYLKTNRLVADSIRLNGAWFKGGINPAGSNGQVQFKNGSALGANSTFYYNSSDTTVFMKNGKLTGYLYLDKNKSSDTTFLATLTNGRVISVPLSRLPTIKSGNGITNSSGAINLGGAATGDMTVTPNSTSVDVSFGTSGNRLGTFSAYTAFGGANPASIVMGPVGIALSTNFHNGVSSDKVMTYTGDFSSFITTDNQIPSLKKVNSVVATKENSLGNPSVDGQALVSTTGGVRSWATLSASPGGANTYVQVNNSGAFGGWDHFRYTVNDSTLRVRNFLASRPAGYTTNMNSKLTANSFASKSYTDSVASSSSGSFVYTKTFDVDSFPNWYYENGSNSFAINGAGTYLYSPDNSKTLSISNTGTDISGDVLVNGNLSAGDISSTNSTAARVTINTNQEGFLKINATATLTNNESSTYHYLNIVRTSGSHAFNYNANFIQLTDNPTTSGTISGKVLSYVAGLTERLSLNPRATGNTVPYIMASHNKVTGNLFELWQQDRLKAKIDTTGKGQFVQLGLDTTATIESTKAGVFYWDNVFNTVSLRLKSGATQQIGQELPIYVQNQTGSTILNGKAVYVLDAGGEIERVALADNGSINRAYKFIGLATTDIPHGGNGYVAVFGKVHGINTGGMTEGKEVYLTTSGGWSQTKPTGAHIVRIGFVTYAHPSDGIITVSPNFETAPNFAVYNNTATSGVEIDSTGITLKGDATVWEDENVAGVELGAGAAEPDLVAVNGTTLFARAFDGNATSEELFGAIELPHSYKEGSNITIHIHWMPTTTGSGNVKWNVDYQWVNAGDTFGNSVTTVSSTVAASGTAWDGTNTDIATLTGTGKTISSHLMFRLYRNPGDAADTYTSDAALIAFGVHYEIDTPGSRQITTK